MLVKPSLKNYFIYNSPHARLFQMKHMITGPLLLINKVACNTPCVRVDCINPIIFCISTTVKEIASSHEHRV
jgi:hypothetical protein